MSQIRERNADLWIGAALLVFCSFAAWRTIYVKAGFSSTAAGPSFVPWLMIGLIAISAVLMMIRALMRETGAAISIDMPDRRTLIAMAAFAALMVAYAAAFMPIGYVPATLATFVVGLILLGERNWLVVILFPVAMTAAIYFGFTKLLSVWLP